MTPSRVAAAAAILAIMAGPSRAAGAQETRNADVELFAEALLTPGFRQADLERNRDQLIAFLTTTLRSAKDELLGLELIQQVIHEVNRLIASGRARMSSSSPATSSSATRSCGSAACRTAWGSTWTAIFAGFPTSSTISRSGSRR